MLSIIPTFNFFFLLLLFFLAVPHSLWDLSSPTRDQTGAMQFTGSQRVGLSDWTTRVVRAQSPHHWTARESPYPHFLEGQTEAEIGQAVCLKSTVSQQEKQDVLFHFAFLSTLLCICRTPLGVTLGTSSNYLGAGDISQDRWAFYPTEAQREEASCPKVLAGSQLSCDITCYWSLTMTETGSVGEHPSSPGG